MKVLGGLGASQLMYACPYPAGPLTRDTTGYRKTNVAITLAHMLSKNSALVI
jgi:hypothetical protein